MKLSGMERKWAEKMLDAVIPRGGEGLAESSASDGGAAEILEEMVAYLPATTGLGLRGAIWFIEFVGPLFGARRLTRFSSLANEDGQKCLAGLSKSDVYFFRNMVLLVKSVACMGWGADDHVRESLGMHEPPKFVTREEG